MTLADIIAKFRNVKTWIVDTVPADLDRIDYILGQLKDAVADASAFIRTLGDHPMVVLPVEGEEDGKKKAAAKKEKKDSVVVTPESIQELRDLQNDFTMNASRNPGAMRVLRKGLAGMDPALEIALFRILQAAIQALINRIENK